MVMVVGAAGTATQGWKVVGLASGQTQLTMRRNKYDGVEAFGKAQHTLAKRDDVTQS
jgi:hypothetical protein